MTALLQRLRERLFASQRRRVLLTVTAVAAVFAAVLAIAWWLGPGGPALTPFPFERFDDKASFKITDYPFTGKTDPFSVSADGKWLCMYVERDGPLRNNPKADMSYLFFDIEQRRFVGKVDFGDRKDARLFAFPSPGWRPDRLLLMQQQRREARKPGKLSALLYRRFRIKPALKPDELEYGFYVLNTSKSTARLQFTERDLLIRGEVTDRIRLDEIRPNRSLTAVAIAKHPTEGGWPRIPRKYVINRFRRGRGTRRYVVSESDFRSLPENPTRLVGWLDDDRTLVISETRYVRSKTPSGRGHVMTQNVHLFDAVRRKTPGSIPLVASFERLLEQGAFGRAIPELESRPIGLLTGQPPRLRLWVAAHPSQPKAAGANVRESVWDVNLETGALEYVTDLDWNKSNYKKEDLVFSPSGNSAVAPATTATLHSSNAETSMSLALWRSGRPLKILSFRIPRLFGDRHDPLPPSFYPQPLPWHMTFLDENTLIHRGWDDTLWKYDLDADKPGLLWRPETSRA